MIDHETTVRRYCTTREEAHQAAKDCYAQAQASILNGKTVKLLCEEDLDPLTVKQRGFLHAAVFPQIAEQAWVTLHDEHGKPVERIRYVADMWKEYFRKRFLGFRYEMQQPWVIDKVTGQWRLAKRKVPVKVRISTEDLDVREYSKHIDTVIDHATTEQGVVFVFRAGEREGARWTPPVRKARKQQQPEEATA
jgi:hypothetical protein